jgi:sec-independent protein translocase protein TatA
MFGLQPLHLVVIAIIALLIFGPKRLPELSRGIGESIKEFKKSTKEMTDPVKDASDALTGGSPKKES